MDAAKYANETTIDDIVERDKAKACRAACVSAQNRDAHGAQTLKFPRVANERGLNALDRQLRTFRTQDVRLARGKWCIKQAQENINCLCFKVVKVKIIRKTCEQIKMTWRAGRRCTLFSLYSSHYEPASDEGWHNRIKFPSASKVKSAKLQKDKSSLYFCIVLVSEYIYKLYCHREAIGSFLSCWNRFVRWRGRGQKRPTLQEREREWEKY